MTDHNPMVASFANIKAVVLPVCNPTEVAAITRLEAGIAEGRITEESAMEPVPSDLLMRACLHMTATRATREQTPVSEPTQATPVVQPADFIQGLTQGITEAMRGIQRPQRVEHFAGSKGENAEQWLCKFEIAAKMNGCINDPITMAEQILCHLKSPASDWFQEQEAVINGGTWDQAKALFLDHFRRRVLQAAADLRRIRQKKDEAVQQFSEGIGALWAKFPNQPEEIKVEDFVSKLLPRYRMIMAYQLPKTTREAMNIAKAAEQRLENEEHEKADLEERVRSRAPEEVIRDWTKSNKARAEDRPAPPRGGQRHNNRQDFSRDYRNNSRPIAFQHPRVQQQAPNVLRSNGTAPMEVDMAQWRGPQCYACGDYGHVARECRGWQHPQSNMIEGTSMTSPKISTQRPANRVGFNVDAQSVQRPAASRRLVAPAHSGKDALLDDAHISLPFRGFAGLPGMGKRVTKFLDGTRPVVSLAQATIMPPEETETHLNKTFATMRLLPGSTSLNKQPSADTVLDSGAMFSMASRDYVKTCGLKHDLVESQLTFTTADGSSADSNYILPKAKVKVGLCLYTVDLVIADKPRFDHLLKVDFLSTSTANIRMDLRSVLLKGTMNEDTIT